ARTRSFTTPAAGSSSPAIARSSVDLPEPERPSSPTISPGRSVRLTFSSTRSSSPSGLRKDLQQPCTSSSGARLSAGAVTFTVFSSPEDPSADAELALGARIQRPPEQPVQRDDEQAQHHDAEHGAPKVRRASGLRDIGAEPVRRELLLSPADHFRHDARIPGAARGGDGAGDVEREHRRQADPAPPQPTAHPEVFPGVAQVR